MHWCVRARQRIGACVYARARQCIDMCACIWYVGVRSPPCRRRLYTFADFPRCGEETLDVRTRAMAC